MNKQELIDNAVHELKGVLRNHKDYWFENLDMFLYYPEGSFDRIYLCTTEEFQQRARELGYVNGYRYGVEYPTNGSKPDLPDDVIIQLSAPMRRGVLSAFAVSAMYAAKGATFKITDERYKPEDASYLDEYFAVQGIDQQKIKNTLISDIAEQGWYCYETQKALRLPPVGVECIVLDNVRAKIVGQTASGYLVYQSVETGFCEMACQATSFKPLDWNRKKYEAIEAASKCFQAHCMHDYSGQPFLDGLAGLYDAGFLRMPEDK